MIESNYSARLLLKPRQTLRIPGKARGQEFERGFAARCNVGCQIDFAHPAGSDPFRNFVMANRLTDEQVRLPIFDNPRGNTGSWGFNETVCPFMRSQKRFDSAAQKLVAGAGRVQKCTNLVRLAIQRGMKDFLNRL